MRLGQVGALYVTEHASRAYARARNLSLEEARRELTELLLDATRPAPRSDADLWRRRIETLDVSARVVCERRLVLVMTVVARRRAHG